MNDEVWAEELNFYNIQHELHAVQIKAQDPMRPKFPVWKTRLWDFLEDAGTSAPARIYSCLSLAIVLAATALFVLESMLEFATPRWEHIFFVYEVVSVAFFTLEYLLRLLVTEQRRLFMMSSLNLVDLGAIIPFYITLLVPEGGGGMGVLRVVRLTKIFRILRIGKYSRGLQLLLQVPEASLPATRVIVCA